MDDKTLEQNLAEVFVEGWDISSTGNGFLVATDWRWPNSDRIEVYVRNVGERADLFVVTDGGDLFNYLFSQGVDLTKDEQGMRIIRNVVENYGAKFVDFQIARGAGEGDLPRAIRMLLEAIKDASLVLWHKLEKASPLH